MKLKTRINKKILLECIGAVVLIIIASFTSVVGEQSTNSSNKKCSPLFNIRILRAANKPNSKVETIDYIGKEKTITLPIPTPANNQLFIRMAIDKISTIDKASFNSLLDIVVNKLCEEGEVKGKNVNQIKAVCQLIRENTGSLKKYLIYEKNGEQLNLWSYGVPCTNDPNYCPTIMHTPKKCFTIGFFLGSLLTVFSVVLLLALKGLIEVLQ